MFFKVLKMKTCFILLSLNLHASAINTDLDIENDPSMTNVLRSIKVQLSQLNAKVASLEEKVQDQKVIITRHEATIHHQELILTKLIPTSYIVEETELKKQPALENYEYPLENDNATGSRINHDDAFTEVHGVANNSQTRARAIVGSWKNGGSDENKTDKRFLETATSGVSGRGNTKVAFSAYLSHDMDGMSGNQTIVFDSLVLNEGNGYNEQTGIFTTPVPGVYLFSFVVNTFKDLPLWVNLVVNGQLTSNDVIWPHFTPSANIQGSNVVLLRLNKGDNVLVATDEQSYGTSLHGGQRYRVTTFSGVFLYE